MIAKITRGQRVGGLVHYLFGPGRANEHTNAHVVAGWDDPERLEPPFTSTGKRDFRPMIAHLNAPMAGREARHGCVWHCSLSSAPGDPVLSDAQWRDIAEEVMDRTGLAPRGDDGACRWVAVRHAENHVHVVATLARQDGKQASISRDRWKVVAACREVEQRYGLTVVANPDRTAHGETKRAEVEKAARTSGNGLADEPVRHRLRREVQTAAVGASGPQDFFDRLRHAGVMVKERFSEQDPAQVTGYAVAWPRACARDGNPLWYGGGKLAPDLSLPKLQAHWSPGSARGVVSNPSPDERMERHHVGIGSALVRVRLRRDLEQAAQQVRSGPEFFARLRESGVVVKERFSERNPGEVTGYAASYPDHTDAKGQTIWYGGGSLASHLSLPGLERRWHSVTGADEATSVSPLSAEERRAVLSEARATATTATDTIRALIATSPGEAGDEARAAGDTLRAVAHIAEPRGRGPITTAADAYARAGRELHGRIPARTTEGTELRSTAKALLLLGRVGGNERVAMMALITALQGLVEATAELREAQARTAQAVAARQAAVDLQAAVDGVRTTMMAEPAQTLVKSIDDPTRGITEDKDRRHGR